VEQLPASHTLFDLLVRYDNLKENFSIFMWAVHKLIEVSTARGGHVSLCVCMKLLNVYNGIFYFEVYIEIYVVNLILVFY
jgi:hypothetical protein